MTTTIVQLPTDRPRGVRAPVCTAMTARTLPPAADPALALGSPLAADEAKGLLLAGFAVVLHRFSQQDEFVLSVQAAHGTHLSGFSFTGEETLSAVTRAETAARFEVSVSGGVGVCFVEAEARGSGQPREAELVVFPPDAGGRRLELHYDPHLFESATADLLLRCLETLLSDAATSAQCPVSRLRLLSGGDAHRTLVEWNDTATSLPYADACLHRAFEEQAARRPEAVAVIQDGESLTYAQADQRANRLAHHLRGLGVGRDARVGMCLERSADLLVTVLAILKAGGAYVPLDPAYPAERLSTMVRDAACTVLVSRGDLTANLPVGTEGSRLVLLDEDARAIGARPVHPPHTDTGPEDLCYVIYTSGSTGVPKPIALRHRGVVNNLMDLNARFEIGVHDTVLALSSPSFDMSVVEFLGTTAAGGTVVVPSPDRAKDPRHWAELAVRHGVTVWNSAPALLELLMDHLDSTDTVLDRLRLVMLGGDWVPVSLPDRVRAVTSALRFIVLGGATEASVHSTVFEVSAVSGQWTSIPYGRPMANQRTYVLDSHLQPVPPGVTGELYLAGTGLARGYLDQPERTAERFSQWSYGPVSDERLYRTGDLARFGPDGLIELIGRADFQVKIHGLRVELGEIEAGLCQVAGVKDAVVVAHPDAVGDPRLVGYVVLAPDAATDIDVDALREHLAAKLPPYMVPATVLALSALPLTPNGKVDRKALPKPEQACDQTEDAETQEALAPGSWEEHVAAVWKDVLGITQVRLGDDFFALGGDSMKALRTMMRIHPALKWADMYRKPTLRELAGHLRETIAKAPASAGTGPDAASPTASGN
ncbi:non-ribosomal peptide synthetase [Streptomyces sp. NPDC054841]